MERRPRCLNQLFWKRQITRWPDAKQSRALAARENLAPPDELHASGGAIRSRQFCFERRRKARHDLISGRIDDLKRYLCAIGFNLLNRWIDRFKVIRAKHRFFVALPRKLEHP